MILKKLQKRAVRIIKNSNYNSHTEPIFKDLHLLKLEDIFICNILKFYYKLEHQTVPQYFINTFTNRFPTHSYDTRNKDQPLFFRPHTQHAEKSLRFALPRTVKNTNSCIIDKVYTHSFHGFCNYMKNHMCTLYSQECKKANRYICQNKAAQT